MHGIIWTNTPQDIRPIWKYGFVWDGDKVFNKRINYVSSRTVNYIIKYVSKIDKEHPYYKTKVLTSKGIGANYVEKQKGQWNRNQYNGIDTKETYRTTTGHEIALPVYWRNKIYTEEEREKLWLQKLDKQERWICGEKIDISINDEEYNKTLQYYRKKNTQLGYGSNYKEWNQIDYENKRRELMRLTRIKNTNTG